MPNTASGFCAANKPSLSMSSAPPSSLAGAPSSAGWKINMTRSEEHTSELQSRPHLVCRLLLEKKNAFTQPLMPAALCCPDDECGTALKNTYFEGKRLTPDAFRLEQRYRVDPRRLLNPAILR